LNADSVRCYAVLGYPISHSRSPAMHNAAFVELGLPHRYHAFSVAPDALREALRGAAALGLGGLNLTVPHKQAALSCMDVLSPEVERIGALNTVVIEHGKLTGHSTDGEGFLAGLAELGCAWPTRALVLGGGGASRSVVDALVHAAKPVHVDWVARDPSELPAWSGVTPRDYADVDGLLPEVQLLVNGTTVGMASGPEMFPVPIPLTRLPAGAGVVDMVYAAKPTRLLASAAEAGLAHQNGLSMLLWQGVFAQERWRGEPLPRNAIAAMRSALG